MSSAVELKLLECERVLGDETVDEEFERRMIASAKEKLGVLSCVVERLCVDTRDRSSPDATFSAVAQIEALFLAIESLNKTLKTIGRSLSGDTVRDLSEARRGSFKNLALNVGVNSLHAEPARGILVPVLRQMVSALSELNTALDA